jgi:hypothetical protein
MLTGLLPAQACNRFSWAGGSVDDGNSSSHFGYDKPPDGIDGIFRRI